MKKIKVIAAALIALGTVGYASAGSNHVNKTVTLRNNTYAVKDTLPGKKTTPTTPTPMPSPTPTPSPTPNPNPSPTNPSPTNPSPTNPSPTNPTPTPTPPQAR